MEENELYLYYQVFAKINQDTRFKVVYTFAIFRPGKDGNNQLGAEITVTKGYLNFRQIGSVFHSEELAIIKEFFTEEYCLEDGEQLVVEYAQGSCGQLPKNPLYGQNVYGRDVWLSRDENGNIAD